MTRLIISCSHGNADPERAVLPFVVGVNARAAEQEATIFLTIEGVHLATTGYADDIVKEGFPALLDTIQAFVADGGRIWVCGTCAKPRGITQSDLIEGATIVSAANLVEELVNGAELVTVG